MKQLFIQCIVWVSLLVLFFMGLDYFLRRNEPMYSEKTIKQIKQLSPSSKTIIFIGTSRTQRAVITDSLEKFYPNYQFINAAMPGIGFIQANFFMSYLNTLPGKKLFIVELVRNKKMDNSAIMFAIHKLNIPNGFSIMAKENGLSTNPIFLVYWQLKFYFNLQLNKLDKLRDWLKAQYGLKINVIRPSFIGYRFSDLNTYKSTETILSSERLQLSAINKIDTSFKTMVDNLIRNENDSTRYLFVLPHVSKDEYELSESVPVFNTIDSLHAWHYTNTDLDSFNHSDYLMNVNHFNHKGAKVYTRWIRERLQLSDILP